MKPKHIPFTLYFICLALAVFVILTVITAQAEAANKQCTNLPQAGITPITLDENGHGLVTVPLSLVFCAPYALTASPQSLPNSEQSAASLSVNPTQLYAFTLTLTGSPHTTIPIHWIAVPLTQQ